jgi:1-acyl-sn-glycerol-3-phosphate acyltransferase
MSVRVSLVVDSQALLDRARHRGVNPIVYWLVRGVLQPFFHLYFRMSRVGREHVPQEGPVIFASNHRSFLDPFIIGCLVRRPMYFVAKKELFPNRFQAWILNSLGAFPIDRGSGDAGAMETARAILERGDCVCIFPEGTRIRPGVLAKPRRGVGRLALETGAPVVPVAVMGTEAIRKGWRIRPHKVRVRAGRPLHFPKVENPSPQLAGAVTERIWPMVALQWEWLGGLAPVRRAAVIGAGSWGTSMAIALHRAGIDVALGTRTDEQAEALRGHRENRHYLPGLGLPDGIEIARAADLDLATRDLVVLAVPARALPAAVAANGERIPSSAAVLLLTKGLVPPAGATPCSFVAERVLARGVACVAGPGHAADALENGASLVLAAHDPALGGQLGDALTRAGFDVHPTTDVIGVEFAGAAKNAAVIAAAAAAAGGPNAAGAAAGKVFAEVAALSRSRGGRPETFAGLAGAGDLVATVVAAQSRNRRAGEMLGRGTPIGEIEPALGQAAEGLDVLPLLAGAMRSSRVAAPTTDGLAAVVEGRADAETWAGAITAPRGRPAAKKVA